MPMSQADVDQAAHLKEGVLAPFYNRINSDAAVITSLQETIKTLKRKRTPSPSPRGESEPRVSQDPVLTELVNGIRKGLQIPVSNETIQLCGLGLLHIIASRPKEVLAVAKEKLSTFPYADVPVYWRRLFEDASASIVADLLQAQASMPRLTQGESGSVSKPDESQDEKSYFQDDWIFEIIHVIDRAIVLTGATGRRKLFDKVLQELQSYAAMESTSRTRDWCWSVKQPEPLKTTCAIAFSRKPPSVQAFETYLRSSSNPKPMIIPALLEDWPAMRKWHCLSYLIKQTHGGRRVVPVEIGKSYTDEDWTQKIMSFAEFADRYLATEEPDDIGYLAQHDLLSQIPALRADITIPDYCWITSPSPRSPVADTAGLSQVRFNGIPLMNMWLGPKGTTTPLHTDPYHNILCQVVGYKYVRLYPPEQSTNVYPHSRDHAGIDMSNTSQIDVEHFRYRSGEATPEELSPDISHEFPLFENAKYTEAILGPGESLYIPLGYWHFVESLSASISVSFWWV